MTQPTRGPGKLRAAWDLLRAGSIMGAPIALASVPWRGEVDDGSV